MYLHGTAARVLTSGHPPETITRVLTYGHSPGSLKQHPNVLIICPPDQVDALRGFECVQVILSKLCYMTTINRVKTIRTLFRFKIIFDQCAEKYSSRP